MSVQRSNFKRSKRSEHSGFWVLATSPTPSYFPAIKKAGDIELVGIASSGGLHAQHSGKKFGFKYATSSDDEIINDPNINTVAILTHHDSHAELVVKALKAGKHVFVEKPLAINSTQLSAISKQLEADSQSLMTVGFNRQLCPSRPTTFHFLLSSH